MKNRHDETIRIGAQTITWGENITDNLPGILTDLAACGYAGVEIGVRHLDLTQPAYYKDLFAAHGLRPVAVHSGGTFWDAAQAEAELRNLEKAVEFAHEVGFPFVTLSGNRDETPASMRTSARAYAALGKHCAAHGVQFVYHNHDWEFANGAKVFQALLEETDADAVKWVPDVAWLWRAGLDPVETVRAHEDRVAYLHLKDCTQNAYCELGDGGVPVREVVAMLPALAIDWVIVEQDESTLLPEACLARNAAFLRDAGVL